MADPISKNVNLFPFPFYFYLHPISCDSIKCFLYRKAPLLDGRTPYVATICMHYLQSLLLSYLSHVAAARYVAKNALQNGWPLGRGTTVFCILVIVLTTPSCVQG